MDENGNPLTDIGLGSGFRGSCSHGLEQVRLNFEENYWNNNWEAPTCDDFEVQATTASKQNIYSEGQNVNFEPLVPI